jgi:hypothetical protein
LQEEESTGASDLEMRLVGERSAYHQFRACRQSPYSTAEASFGVQTS